MAAWAWVRTTTARVAAVSTLGMTLFHQAFADGTAAVTGAGAVGVEVGGVDETTGAGFTAAGVVPRSKGVVGVTSVIA